MKNQNLNQRSSDVNPTSKYVNIDGQLWAVPKESGFVFQCHRGFWFEKKRKPEIVTTSGVDEWTPEKRLLQHRNTSGFLVPLQTAPAENWRQRIFMSTSETNPASSANIRINCNVG